MVPIDDVLAGLQPNKIELLRAAVEARIEFLKEEKEKQYGFSSREYYVTLITVYQDMIRDINQYSEYRVNHEENS